jgi:hypothetical protein
VDRCNVWFEARDRHVQELGTAHWKMYKVSARTMGMVPFEGPAVTWEEDQRWDLRYNADEVIQELDREDDRRRWQQRGPRIGSG